MAKHTLKSLRREHRKIIKVCLTILQHYEWKGYGIDSWKEALQSLEYVFKNFSWLLILQQLVFIHFRMIAW